MMLASRPRRTREVTGPTPHSVAIFARPTNKRPPEHLILERRKQEEKRQQAEEATKYNKFCDLKNDWERFTDRRIQINTVQRRVKSLLQADSFAIEDRRERLRDLLSAEEAAYLEEMASKEETVIERQAKMRERAKHLKEKREAERLKFVQEKLEQQWLDQCEEMRSTVSKRQQDQVAAERMEQLRIKADNEEAQRQEEDMYADLWYADMMAKAKREEAETQRRINSNHDMLNTLNQQMAALEAQKQEERHLREEEARLLKEEHDLRMLEERCALEEKRRKQEQTRNMYDRSLKMKQEKQAREMQEQLAFDLKILEQLLEESRNEAREAAQRKRELREEDGRYRAYLLQLKEDEAAMEREIAAMIEVEVEKQWQKKMAQWKLEKQARRKLLDDVLAARRQQVDARLRENNEKLAEAQREREELVRRIEENKRLEAQQQEREHQKHLQHQNDLISQMDFNNRLRGEEDEEERLMWVQQRNAELEYQRKLEDALNFPDANVKSHPMRRAVSGRRSAQSTNNIIG